MCLYSQTSTYGHLFTKATFLCPQGGLCEEVCLYQKSVPSLSDRFPMNTALKIKQAPWALSRIISVPLACEQVLMRCSKSKGEAVRNESASEASVPGPSLARFAADSSRAASPLLVPQRMRACSQARYPGLLHASATSSDPKGWKGRDSKTKSLHIEVIFVPGPPEPPNNVQVFPTCDRIDVTWEASRKDGGSAVTGYTIKLQRGEQTVQSEYLSTSQRTTSLRSLEKGTQYEVRISSSNALGEGEWRVIPVNTTIACKESYAR